MPRIAAYGISPAARRPHIPNSKSGGLSQSAFERRLLVERLAPSRIAMNSLPMPRRLLNALVPQPGGAPHLIDPVLALESLPPPPPEAPRPLGRRAIERALEEGSRRVYQPMLEAEVIEQQARR